jgi:methylmalonyl-CoA mutase
VCRVVDPLGGSAYVERLTADLAARARVHMAEVERLGGMTRAIETGLPKRRIEECAARAQARIDSGRQVIVGVNRFVPTTEELVPVLEIDNAAVRRAQVERLEANRRERDNAAVERTLAALTEVAAGANGNLLAACIEAAAVGATVGEMSLAMERVFGRHQAEPSTVRGVYKNEMGGDDADLLRARERVRAFAERAGRQPRILVAKLGQDGHDRGQKVVATALADVGFDVDVGSLFQTPQETARQAIENDVHVVGVSSLAAGHLALVPALRAELDAGGGRDVLIVVGGVVPPKDYAALRAAGAAAIFGPGTRITRAAVELVDALEARARR